jgi:tetratricopeptide (TPR) repeat protein
MSRAAQDDAARADGADSDDDKLRRSAEQFLIVLERTPRRGTALDRLYGYHVEAGSLDQFVKQFANRTLKNGQDGAAWMILGLLESQRGHDAAAVQTFAQAEKVLPENALASYYLGQSLVLVGRPDDAAAAFERALSKKPARADLLEVFQALGRVYQRGQKPEQALEVWSRFEKLFPDDLRVQEQIATTLVEEGEYAQALPRLETLARKVKDEYRAATFRVEVADIKVRLGQPKEALADFENLLSRLNPDHWLYRDIRRRIDEVFLRTDDQAGLAAYYESWIGKYPEDLPAMTRLARILAGIGRAREAQGWLHKALQLAPSRKDLRLALIEQLVTERQYAQAIAQYEILARNDPTNPDIVREWGRLILKDGSIPEAERKSAAASVWRRLLDARPKDSLTATQVADLFRQSEMPDEALELYKKAVELSPDAVQYREYLGEYYHSLKHSGEALAAWREIAAGKNRTPENVARLAEVLANFGYLDEAIVNILEACRLDAGELKYRLKAADLLSRAEKYGDALAQLADAEKCADGPEAQETVLRQRIHNLQLAERLDAEIVSLQQDLRGPTATAERWHVLARYLEAARRFAEADRAIGKALALDGVSILYRTAAARIAEAAGNLQGAADAGRALVVIDRRNRTEHLMNIARLEAQLGRIDQALQAGRDLLAAAPGNPDHHEFFAQLCFQLGRVDDGLDALRRSVRHNPAEPKQMLTLASALADQFRTDEAIELYWRAFDKSSELEAKLGVVQRLADLYMQTNRLDRLIDRLDSLRREANSPREMSICLAQAHQSAGDYGTARQELERLLEQNSRDTQLLQQLSNLAETEGDLALAVKYQQQLVAITAGKEAQSRLAQLLVRNGESDEAFEILGRLAEEEQDPTRLLTALDSLLAQGKRVAVVSIAERALRDQPQNWELLYRAGEALARDRPAEAARRFRSILALALPDDDAGEKARGPAAYAQSLPPAAASRGLSGTAVFPLVSRTSAVRQIRAAVGFDDAFRTAVSRIAVNRGPWAPTDFGQARIAALAWLLRQAEKDGKKDEFVLEFRKPGDMPAPTARELWDWYYLQLVEGSTAEVRNVARQLSHSGDPLGQWLYLSDLSSRPGGTATRLAGLVAGPFARADQDENDAAQPLSPEEIDHVLASYRELWKNRPEMLFAGGSSIVDNVVLQLEIAGRNADADAIFLEIVEGAHRPESRRIALELAASRGNVDAALKVFDKIAAEQLSGPGRSPTSAADAALAAAALAQLMALRATEHEYAEVLRIWQRYLAFAQRRQETAALGHAPIKRSPARGTTARTARIANNLNVQVWIGRRPQFSEFDYPDAPNEFYDVGAVNLLREMYVLYQHDDLLSDLVAHFVSQANDAPAGERRWWSLGLAYLRWWNEDRDEAVAEFARAVEMVPNVPGLQFELAALHERNQDYFAALSIVDGITPLDHLMMQERETAALRLAVRTGQIERARLAAERLFGLRLDAETQVQLVAEMRGLGMNEHADTVLARARRQAGNRVEALVSLMNQYQADQKTDLAVQVAQDILRRKSSPAPSRTTRVVTSSGRAANLATAGDNDPNRKAALAVLSQSGKLDELIGRAEAQLVASPASVQLLQTLTEYYEAAGRRPKVLETLQRMIAVRPDDARLRFQVAQQLLQAGNVDDAIEHYKAAIKKEPALFGQNYPQMQQAFRRANKTAELVSLLDDVDLTATGNVTTVMRILQMSLMNDGDQEAGLKLFRRAWDAFPGSRMMMIRSLQRNELWKLPEVQEYARQAVISCAALSATDPWGSSQQVISFTSTNLRGNATGNVMTIVTPMTHLVDVAQSQDALPALKQEVEQALEKHPAWLGGKVLLAVLDSRTDNLPRARQIAEELLADRRHPIPYYTAWILGQELDNHESTRAIVRTLYESALGRQNIQLSDDLSDTPTHRLIEIYKQAGEPDKARALVLRSTQENSRIRTSTIYPAGYLAYLKLTQAAIVGQQLVELGYPVDALRFYVEVLEDEGLPEAARQYVPAQQYENYIRQLEQSIESTRKSLVSDKNLAGTLATLLEPRPAAERKPRDPAVNLLLQIYPRELKAIRMTSPVEATLRAASTAVMKRTADERIAGLLEEYPDDVSVQIVAAIAAIAESRPEAIAAAALRLEKLVQEFPLEELPAGSRANSRQRAEAARWLGLWLVARECLKSPAHREVALKLADRSLEAARRQGDRKYALCVLREWGQIALESEDQASAEARWSEMVSLVLPRAANSKAGRRALPVPTLAQFNQAADIAWLAGDNGLFEMSLQSVREALQAGPPVNVTPTAGGFAMPGMGSSTRPIRANARLRQSDSPNVAEVEDRLMDLVQLWNRKTVPLADQYEALAAVAFPEGRPAEIFLYPKNATKEPKNFGDVPSLGKLIVSTAVKAGRADDLSLRIASREKQPLSRAAADALKSLLEAERKTE